MHGKTDEESALKKLKTYNKILAFLFPALIVLGAMFVFVNYGGFKNTPAFSDNAGTTAPPVESTHPQVEVLPQMIRSNDESAIAVEKDPFESPKKLTGIIYSSKRPIAIIESGGISYIVEINDIIGNSSWMVSDIQKDALTLQSGDKSEVLKLENVIISQSDGAAAALEDSVIMNIRNADIRDVLSVFGKAMDKNILFTGQPTQVNYSIKKVKVSDSLNYLLKTLGMEYIENASTIIVGTRDTLNKDYFNSIALTQFTLKYISSDILATQIDALGVPVKKIVLDNNKNAFWVQGLPSELGKVRELVNILDKAENASGQASTATLTPVQTTYITAQQMNGVLSEMGIESGMIIDSNPKKLWIYGSKELIAQISEIRKKIDTSDNAGAGNIILTEKNMNWITAQEMIDILNELNVDVNAITFDRRVRTIWLTGYTEAVAKASELISTFDVAENVNYNLFFVHRFNYITALEGKTRFEFLGIEGAKTYTFEFPEFSKSMMVFCSTEYKQTIINNLTMLDTMADKIKLPVDYSTASSGVSKLQARRDLIAKMMGISASTFTITGNISRDDTPRYIMYIEETPENIARVKDLIKFIDDPINASPDHVGN